MKKTLVAAITSALVIGAASTTFAAANPFSDVPADHWSYDAVAKLAHEGVIEGYGDGTFRGDAKITRYEMAQMVAKAMAKEGVSSSNKATIDKLSAEYADELNNLGVRVSALEKKTDNVKFTGFLRLDGTHYDDGDNSDVIGKIRLDMNAAVNDDWAVKARFESTADLDNDDTDNQDTDRKTKLVQAYAEGPLFGANAKLGKFGTFDAANLTNGGIIIDTEVSGAEFQFGKALQTTLTVGRLDNDDYKYELNGTSDYAAIQFGYDATDKLALAAGYYNVRNSQTFPDGNAGSDDTNGIWNLGFDYKFNKNLTLGGLYAQSSLDDAVESDNEDAYSAQLTYKGAEFNAPGSFGAWVAYRQIGKLASIAPTYDGVDFGTKGTEVGVDYMLDKNILAKVVYFDGEEITGGADVEKVFGRVEFQF